VGTGDLGLFNAATAQAGERKRLTCEVFEIAYLRSQEKAKLKKKAGPKIRWKEGGTVGTT